MEIQRIVIFPCMLVLPILLTQLLSTSATNANNVNLCLETNNPNQSTCQGRGTSDVADSLIKEINGLRRQYIVITSIPAATYILAEVVIFYVKGVQLSITVVATLGYAFFNTIKLKAGTPGIFIPTTLCQQTIMSLPSTDQVPGAPGLTLDVVYGAILVSVSPFSGTPNVFPCYIPIQQQVSQRGMQTLITDYSGIQNYKKFNNGRMSSVESKSGSLSATNLPGETVVLTGLTDVLQVVIQVFNGLSGSRVCDAVNILLAFLSNAPVPELVILRYVLIEIDSTLPFEDIYWYIVGYSPSMCIYSYFEELFNLCGRSKKG